MADCSHGLVGGVRSCGCVGINPMGRNVPTYDGVVIMLVIVRNEPQVFSTEGREVFFDTGWYRYHDTEGFYGERHEWMIKIDFNEFYLLSEDRPSTRTGIKGWLDRQTQVVKKQKPPTCSKYTRGEVASWIKRFMTDANEYQRYLIKLGFMG